MTLGLHITRFKLGLAAQAAVGGASASGRAEAQDALVPLPTVGLYGKHDFTREWSVQARIDYFTLSFGDYGGGLMNLMAAVGYRFSDRATSTTRWTSRGRAGSPASSTASAARSRGCRSASDGAPAKRGSAGRGRRAAPGW